MTRAETTTKTPRMRIGAALTVALLAVTLTACIASPDAAPSASPTGTSSSIDGQLQADLEAAFDAGFQASGVPGAIVGVWIPGRGEWVSARGVSNLDTGEPMDRRNQTKIGSITKTMAGTIALQVIGEGVGGLTLDSTIDRWYPDFPEASRITVRMLLNMSSGVADWGEAQLERICSDPHLDITPDEVIAIGASLPREPYAPGEGQTYSSMNTFILGRILEQVTGTDFTTLMDSRLLRPLGLDRTRFAPDGVLAPPLTHGYTDFCPDMGARADSTDWSLHEAWAAGAAESTLDDLHTWSLALGEGYELTAQLRSARVEDLAPTIPGSPPGYFYGLGMGVRKDVDTGCVTALGHAGAEPGYGADILFYPTTGAVFALIVNGDGGTGAAFAEIERALYPVIDPLVIDPSADACAASTR